MVAAVGVETLWMELTALVALVPEAIEEILGARALKKPPILRDNAAAPEVGATGGLCVVCCASPGVEAALDAGGFSSAGLPAAEGIREDEPDVVEEDVAAPPDSCLKSFPNDHPPALKLGLFA